MKPSLQIVPILSMVLGTGLVATRARCPLTSSPAMNCLPPGEELYGQATNQEFTNGERGIRISVSVVKGKLIG